MNKNADPFLTENTRFWVVRARVTAGQVTGLATIFSGAYIGIEPSVEGQKKRHFKGLEKQPIVTGEVPGRQFKLVGTRLGSLAPGSPIYFRQIKVGQVVDYTLEADGRHVDVRVFIETPFDQFVRRNSRFWVASGLDVALTANGLRIDTESVVSLLIGGLAFTTFPNEALGPEADEGDEFKLYDTFEEARDDRYTIKRDYIVVFQGSVRGLSLGAPVEFRGMRIGTVTDIKLEADFDNLDFTIPVRIRVEPERLALPVVNDKEYDERGLRMIKKGLRAQLKTGNLLTGQLFVDLDILPDAPPVEIRYSDGLLVIPSAPSSEQAIMQGITRFVKRLEELPLEAIGRDLQDTMAGVDRLVNGSDLRHTVQSLQAILKELEVTSRTLNADTLPRFNAALQEMGRVLKDLDGWVSADAPVQEDLRKMLRELAAAGRAVNDLADMLGRHPEALLQGKGSEGQ